MGFGLPLAIMAGAKLFNAIKGGKDKRDAAEANTEAFAENERRRVESERVGHGESERTRQARAGALGNALAGTDFAIDPALLQAAGQERAFTGFERTAPEVTGSMTSDILGGIAGTAGDAASAYLAGLEPGAQAPSGGGGTIAAATPGGTPFATPNLDVRFKAPKLI
jgi:hypothetical protein